jgi:hypothetical protein
MTFYASCVDALPFCSPDFRYVVILPASLLLIVVAHGFCEALDNISAVTSSQKCDYQ